MKGKKEKKDFEQNIGQHEVFLESVPTALIITVIRDQAKYQASGFFGKNLDFNNISCE